MAKDGYYSSIRTDLLEFIPSDIKKTLDVGCASGVFSEQLKKNSGVEAWGIEMVEEHARIAQTKLDEVLIGTFEQVRDNLPKNYFDCIFFNDVLEHMPDPEDCLKKIRENLKPGKTIIASIPNVRHVEVLKGLLFKKDWKYTDSGILDRTHLRFYTKKSILRMFDDCGYTVLQIKGVRGVSPYCLTSIVNILSFNALEDIKYCQFAVVATPK